MPRVRKMRKPMRRFKRKFARKTALVNRALAPIAQRYITTMKYSEIFTLNALNGYQYQYNLNSIFDPNRTGTGHQPYGHDTLQTLYNRYRVIGCKWVLNFYNSANMVQVATQPANEVLSPTGGFSELAENPRTRWKLQVPGGSATPIKGSISLPSLVGRSKGQYMADDRYQAQFGSSPTELAILNVIGAAINGSGVDINCTITLTYKVECFDVKHLAQS